MVLSECFIWCSTKGNLKGHMTKMHMENSSGESLEENSSKFIFLDRDISEEEHISENDDHVLLSSLKEKDSDLEEVKSSGQPSEEKIEDEMVYLQPHSYDTTIDALYAKLSTDFLANNTKRADVQTSTC